MSNSQIESVGGNWEPHFANVVEAFSQGLPACQGAGAALSIWLEGTEVVNVWAGDADARNSKPWGKNTTSVLFSSTKGLAALAVALLADEGHLDYEMPVAEVWPEFAAHGKGRITVRDVLAHRAGLPAPEGSMTLAQLVDSERFANALAAQPPLWPVAQAHLYHALTWGPLVREIIRRATGEDVAEIFRRRIAKPLNASVELQATDADLASLAHVSVAAEHQEMVAKTVPLAGELAVRGITAGGALPLTLATDDAGANDPRLQKSGLLSMAGIGTASGLAKVWSAFAEPRGTQPVLSKAGLAELTRPHSDGPSFGAPAGSPAQRWGAGVQLASRSLPWLSDSSFGHDGAGGQTGFADPLHRIGFGYVTNYLHYTNRVGPILDALRIALS